ncbi:MULTISPECIES: class I adenylate-forming enzyme family protein [Desulfococcus]|uniref:AMP-dependent synthetase and ligase n=1 Tax=Desulfococcus multivorans DSM 2059 TaxID=1121405 RepID=S7V1X9_DESML|nr:AMP-binding protein [Desulfococcus multivorans]AOY59255.1 AMP-dependent synthetase and ligase [Desulfococcus multivorans]AQV01478.1 AMP-binding protein [Desulfococcus multivorans]EPR38638.1 AMP-dependent synthetase and ligase [Desulfococcus multivorans DSM 2059]MDX9819711.1 AMP-binding protein [Desulfococcus multivorans]SKA26687.1 Acyl-CoA synthetase (AMP-forming)/AMP-acid ligase II [Desulfococcus multivorans DSM 2059]
MNFSKYAAINARHHSNKICLIERTPSIEKRRTLTWKQFNDAINRVANYLAKECGVKDGDKIMHLQNNSLEWLITYFAIIRLGAIVVPLNFRFESADVLYAAEVCNPQVFLLGSEFLKVVQPIQQKLETIRKYICIGDTVPDDMIDYAKVDAYDDSSDAMVDVADHHDLAMMFTSGTTGKPKPVMHTHFSMKNTAAGNGMSYFVEKNDNYLIFLPLFHSGTMFLWAPFYATGATGTILREFNNARYIFDALAEEKCTDTLFVVPIAIMALNAIDDGTINLADYDLSAWRYMEIGAQPVPFDIMKKLVETLPCGVSNIYGITEGGGGGLFNLYPEDVLKKPGSIGKPTYGVEAKIIDWDGSELPSGSVGELLFSTERMMKEYHGNPEMTAATIQDGWLRTGDLLKTDEEGFYYIVDRMKDMITSGGENIFPVEIEDALMDHPDIEDVACIGYPDDRLVEIVLAVVQLKAGKKMTEAELIEYAKSKIATYKAPRKVIFDEIPRSATGKVMKPVLREKYTGRREAFKQLA